MEQKKIGTSTDGREMHYSAGIMVECNGKYLLMDRINPPPGFACPGGHVDVGEEPEVAAIRELKEEAGITANKLEFVCEEEVPWNYCKEATVHYWYLYKISVDTEDVVIAKDEAKSLAWYTPQEMKNIPIEEVWLYWFKKLGIL